MTFRNFHNFSAQRMCPRTASPARAGAVHGSVARLESIGGFVYRIDALPRGGKAP